MNTFSDAFEKAIDIDVDGRRIAVRQLTTRDYLPWIEELTNARRAKERELIPPGTKPAERWQILKNIEVNEVTPDDLVPLIFTARGTLKVLELSLTRAGLTVDQATKFIDSRPAKSNERLAAQVSGLLSATRFATIYDLPAVAATSDDAAFGGNPNPNTGAADQNAAA